MHLQNKFFSKPLEQVQIVPFLYFSTQICNFFKALGASENVFLCICVPLKDKFNEREFFANFVTIASPRIVFSVIVLIFNEKNYLLEIFVNNP